MGMAEETAVDEQQDTGADEAAELRKQLAAARSEAAERRIALKAWSSLGVEPEAIKELLEAQRAGKEEAAKKSGQYEKLLEEKEARWKAENEKAVERAQKLQQTLDREVRLRASTEAILGLEGSVKLLLPHVQTHTELEETEDGGYRVVVLDANGKRRFSTKGEPLTVAELVAEMREDPEFMSAFKGSGASGGGAAGTAGRHGGTGRVSRKTMTTAQKGEYIAAHGLEAYNALPFS
jgi:DNA-binding transcriptional MerR regulator